MSRTNQTITTENGQIWKNVLARFISRILIKKDKIQKKSQFRGPGPFNPFVAISKQRRQPHTDPPLKR
jgi:hypothetical protein